MALYFNDYKLDSNFVEATPDVAWPIENEHSLGGRWTKTDRGPTPDRVLNLTLTFGSTDADAILANLEGVFESSNYVLIRSDSQPIWKNVKSVYAKIETWSPSRPAGFAYLTNINITAVIVGVPVTEGGDAQVGYYWQQSPLAPYVGSKLNASAPAANAKEPAWWFPWYLGGRNGMDVTAGGKSQWSTHAETDMLIANSGSATWAMAKTEDGTTVMRVKNTQTDGVDNTIDNSQAIFKTHLLKNGTWTMRFRTSVALTVALMVRLDTSDINSDGYYATVVTSTASVTFDKKDGTSRTTYLSGTAPNALNDGEWHTLSLQLIDQTYIVSVDGNVLITGSESTNWRTVGGYWGIRVTGAVGEFDIAEAGHLPNISEIALPLSTRANLQTFSAGSTTRWRPVGANLLGNWDSFTLTTVGGTITAETDPTRKLVGTQSFKLTWNSNGYYTIPANTLVVGKTYLVEAYAKSDASTNQMRISIYTPSNGLSTTEWFSNYTTGDVTIRTWERVYLLYTHQADGSSNRLYLYNNAGTNGNAWFDGVSIRECVPVVVQPHKRLVATQELVS